MPFNRDYVKKAADYLTAGLQFKETLEGMEFWQRVHRRLLQIAEQGVQACQPVEGSVEDGGTRCISPQYPDETEAQKKEKFTAGIRQRLSAVKR